jgi:hypothetical protein
VNTTIKTLVLGVMILSGLVHSYHVMWTACAIFCCCCIYESAVRESRARRNALTIARAQEMARAERIDREARATAQAIADIAGARYYPNKFDHIMQRGGKN